MACRMILPRPHPKVKVRRSNSRSLDEIFACSGHRMLDTTRRDVLSGCSSRSNLCENGGGATSGEDSRVDGVARVRNTVQRD